MEEIVTGEAVILDLPYARFPTRILARIIDMFVEIVALIVVLLLDGIGGATGALDDAAVTAVGVAGFVLVIVGYPIACETLSRGRTVGKQALGLRVVADDGGPERFRQALVRSLAGVIECWLLAGVPALITSMLSARGKRLGDVFAGTFVVRERAPRAAAPYTVQGAAYGAAAYAAAGAGGRPPAVAARIHPGLQAWAASLDLSALPEQLAASAASYLSRFWQLNEIARDQLGRQLASDVAARVSPPPPAGVMPADYLYTVVAERSNRELARFTPPAAAAPTGPVRGPSAAPPPGWFGPSGAAGPMSAAGPGDAVGWANQGGAASPAPEPWGPPQPLVPPAPATPDRPQADGDSFFTPPV